MMRTARCLLLLLLFTTAARAQSHYDTVVVTVYDPCIDGYPHNDHEDCQAGFYCFDKRDITHRDTIWDTRFFDCPQGLYVSPGMQFRFRFYDIHDELSIPLEETQQYLPDTAQLATTTGEVVETFESGCVIFQYLVKADSLAGIFRDTVLESCTNASTLVPLHKRYPDLNANQHYTVHYMRYTPWRVTIDFSKMLDSPYGNYMPSPRVLSISACPMNKVRVQYGWIFAKHWEAFAGATVLYSKQGRVDAGLKYFPGKQHGRGIYGSISGSLIAANQMPFYYTTNKEHSFNRSNFSAGFGDSVINVRQYYATAYMQRQSFITGGANIGVGWQFFLDSHSRFGMDIGAGVQLAWIPERITHGMVIEGYAYPYYYGSPLWNKMFQVACPAYGQILFCYRL